MSSLTVLVQYPRRSARRVATHECAKMENRINTSTSRASNATPPLLPSFRVVSSPTPRGPTWQLYSVSQVTDHACFHLDLPSNQGYNGIYYARESATIWQQFIRFARRVAKCTLPTDESHLKVPRSSGFYGFSCLQERYLFSTTRFISVGH